MRNERRMLSRARGYGKPRAERPYGARGLLYSLSFRTTPDFKLVKARTQFYETASQNFSCDFIPFHIFSNPQLKAGSLTSMREKQGSEPEENIPGEKKRSSGAYDFRQGDFRFGPLE